MCTQFGGHICTCHYFAINVEWMLKLVVCWHIYSKLLGIYSYLYIGYVHCLCNVVAISVQGYMSNVCAVSLVAQLMAVTSYVAYTIDQEHISSQSLGS